MRQTFVKWPAKGSDQNGRVQQVHIGILVVRITDAMCSLNRGDL